jgi:hypothetical protein
MFRRQLVLPRARRAARRRVRGQVQRARIAYQRVRLVRVAERVAWRRVEQQRPRWAFRHRRLSVEKAGRARGHGPEQRQSQEMAQNACRLRRLKAVDPADELVRA